MGSSSDKLRRGRGCGTQRISILQQQGFTVDAVHMNTSHEHLTNLVLVLRAHGAGTRCRHALQALVHVCAGCALVVVACWVGVGSFVECHTATLNTSHRPGSRQLCEGAGYFHGDMQPGGSKGLL